MASVRIPTIGPGNGPEFRPQTGNAEPSPVGRAIAGFGGAISDVGKFFEIQQYNDDQLRLADQSLKIQNAGFTARMAAKLAPATAQLQTFDDAYNQAIKGSGILDDPDNARIADKLKLVSMRHFQDVRQEVMLDQLTATAKDQQAQAKNLGPQFAQRAAVDFAPTTTAGTTTFADGPQAIEARQQYKQVIDRMVGIGPEAKAAMLTDFDQKVAFQRGQAIATGDHPENAFDYVNANPQFTPEQRKQILDLSVTTIERPHKVVDAELAAERGVNDQQVLTEIAQGKPTPDLDAMMARGALSENVYQHATGHPYVSVFPDQPGQADIYQKIVNEQGPEDGPQVRRMLADAQVNRMLSRQTTGQLILNSYDREKALKDPLVYAKHALKSRLMDEFFPPHSEFKVNPFDTEANRSNFEARFTAEMDGVKAPSDIPKAEKSLMDWYNTQTHGKKGMFDSLLKH